MKRLQNKRNERFYGSNTHAMFCYPFEVEFNIHTPNGITFRNETARFSVILCQNPHCQMKIKSILLLDRCSWMILMCVCVLVKTECDTPCCMLPVILAALAITSLNIVLYTILVNVYAIKCPYLTLTLTLSLAWSCSFSECAALLAYFCCCCCCFVLFCFVPCRIIQIHKLQFMQLLLTKLITKMVILDQLNAQCWSICVCTITM